ncbi:hypothetical protein Ppa05_66300 [Planomonospora parontospora subsp. antibiotica]|nr:hypothetical protein Ppa05_66300 [Planomonospora parontospora subsp. antibiotica]
MRSNGSPTAAGLFRLLEGAEHDHGPLWGWGPLRERMPQRQGGVEFVAVAPDFPAHGEVPRGGEIGKDALRGALGDLNAGGHVADPHAGVTGDAQQHMGVVGQEGPVHHAHHPTKPDLDAVNRRWRTPVHGIERCSVEERDRHRPCAADLTSAWMKPSSETRCPYRRQAPGHPGPRPRGAAVS